jgi:tetratricopeptide (TPR) repeat protein
MIDATTGAKTGGGKIHVQDQAEMKLRMPELVRQTTLKPEEQARLAREGAESEKALNEARSLAQAGRYDEAAKAARAGLARSPDSVALQSLLSQAERQAEKARLEEARRLEAERQQALAEAARQRQAELAKQAEAARLRAEQEAKARDEAARRDREERKQRAYDQLIAQARAAVKQGNHAQAVSLFESAAALRPSDGLFRELAQAKAKVEEAARARAAEEERKRREAEAKQREDELARVRAKVEEERKRREAAELARSKEQESREQAEQAALLGKARGLLAARQYEQALAALHAARKVKPADEVEKLIAEAEEGRARAEAAKKGEQARAELERKQAEEKARREQAEVEARKKQQAYQAALERGQKALAARRYDEAVAAYQEAGRLFRTDAVLAGLRQAEEARAKEAARADEEKRVQAEGQKRAAEVARLLKEGQAALDARQFDRAATAFGEAKRLDPRNVEALAGLSKVDQARDAARRTDEEARRRQEEEKRRTEVARLVGRGQGAMAGKRYEEAVKAFGEALKLVPNDPAAMKGLREAQQAVEAGKPPPPPPPPEYTKRMTAAAALEKAQKYAEAARAYREALKVVPGDAKASAGEEFAQRMGDGQRALAARKFPQAIREFEMALKLRPKDPDATDFLKRARDGKP